MWWLVVAVGVAGGGAVTITSTNASISTSPVPPTNGHSLSGASSDLVVRITGQGLARGFLYRGTKQWLSIPYAAPPVGDLRYYISFAVTYIGTMYNVHVKKVSIQVQLKNQICTIYVSVNYRTGASYSVYSTSTVPLAYALGIVEK